MYRLPEAPWYPHPPGVATTPVEPRVPVTTGVGVQVLFLSQLLPWPLDGGAKVRSQHLLTHLIGAGHDVTLCAFRRPSDGSEAITDARTLCTAVELVPLKRSAARNVVDLAASWWGPLPFTVARDWLVPMRECLRALVSRGDGFDVVHADQIQMAPYALFARQWSRRRPGLVLDLHNATFRIYEQLAAFERHPIRRALLARESRRLARYERRVCGAVDHVVWVSAVDRQALTHVAPDDRAAASAQSTVIPIAVDPGPAPARSAGVSRVLLLGGLNWPPNEDAARWMVRRIWPAIRAQRPRARLKIVGRCSHRQRRWLQRHGGDGVEVTGYVDDLDAELADAAVLAVPLRAGSGLRVKIVDAWRRGLPIVSTPIGAEGLEAADGRNVLLADQPESFAAAVVRLLESPELRADLAAAGRQTVETRYDFHTAYTAWDDVYRDAVGAATPCVAAAKRAAAGGQP